MLAGMLKTTKFPALFEDLRMVTRIDKSKVKKHPMFGDDSEVGRGLIATRDMETGEQFYTILETDVNVLMVGKSEAETFQVFDLGKNNYLKPLCGASLTESALMDIPEEKPHLFFLQHDDKGNVTVTRLPAKYLHITYTLPTHYLHITYTLPTHYLHITYTFLARFS